MAILGRQDRLERLASNDERVHGGHELRVAVRFAAALREPVERPIGARNEAVQACRDEHGGFHGILVLIAGLYLAFDETCPHSDPGASSSLPGWRTPFVSRSGAVDQRS